MRVFTCTFREYVTVRHEKKVFQHWLGVAVSRGAVAAITHYLQKQENKVRATSQMCEYLQLFVY